MSGGPGTSDDDRNALRAARQRLENELAERQGVATACQVAIESAEDDLESRRLESRQQIDRQLKCLGLLDEVHLLLQHGTPNSAPVGRPEVGVLDEKQHVEWARILIEEKMNGAAESLQEHKNSVATERVELVNDMERALLEVKQLKDQIVVINGKLRKGQLIDGAGSTEDPPVHDGEGKPSIRALIKRSLAEAGTPMQMVAIVRRVRELGSDAAEASIRTALHRMREAGEVQRIDRGAYRLPES
jgi:hypothetical protein